MRHLLRKAALRQLRCAATGEAPQHTLRVGQQLRRHAVCEARVALGAVGTPGSTARVGSSVRRDLARDADSSKRVWRLADMSITNKFFYVFSQRSFARAWRSSGCADQIVGYLLAGEPKIWVLFAKVN